MWIRLFDDCQLSFFEQQVKFKSQIEQQKLQLQREHSVEMEQILEKVRRKIILIF